jgi:tRNA dimethylallyltransferase
MAVAEIEAARTAGKLPILCGGTGLYIKALMEGLSPIPDIPAAVRDDVRRRLAAEGPEALHAILVERDPVTAARLNPSDSQRVARALEVLEGTGRSLGEWQEETGEGPPADLCFTIILLMPPRDALYADIDARLATMLEDGALAEVEALHAMDLDSECPAARAVGVPELLRYLAGDCDINSALASAQQATRRFAKRQMTWFRNQIIADFEAKEKYSESLRHRIFAFIRENVLTESG